MNGTVRRNCGIAGALLLAVLLSILLMGATYPENTRYIIRVKGVAGAPYGGEPIECWRCNDNQHLTCYDGYDFFNVRPGEYIYKKVVFVSTGFSGKILIPVAIAKLSPSMKIEPVIAGVVVTKRRR